MTQPAAAFLFFAGLLLGLFASQLVAQGRAATATANQIADPAGQTATVIDEQAGVIRFVIAGEEKARIDATGLHVNGDIGYSGSLTDTVTYEPIPERAR